MPVRFPHLRRVSLNRGHWRQARWLLAGEAVLAGIVGTGELMGVFVLAPRTNRLSLAWALMGIAAAAAISVTWRRMALLFSAAVGTAALAMVVVSAAGAAYGDPGPLGLTAPAILVWAVLFCYNFALGVWMVPDHIEGPEWVARVRVRRNRSVSDAPTRPK